MSNSGIVGGLARVSIPSGMRKTIQNIKEITGNHGEDEIYAMLKECSMDPNETAQKLLYQGQYCLWIIFFSFGISSFYYILTSAHVFYFLAFCVLVTFILILIWSLLDWF